MLSESGPARTKIFYQPSGPTGQIEFRIWGKTKELRKGNTGYRRIRGNVLFVKMGIFWLEWAED